MQRALDRGGQEARQDAARGAQVLARRLGERAPGPAVGFGAARDRGDEQGSGDGGRIDRALVRERAVEVVQRALALTRVAGEKVGEVPGAPEP
ncbi:hypothetical protein [Nocardiopsis sp. RV163]|uniref:hypothetical protein n=1 Tax=Nocardiopsis sp. RV163 TaxID=1661388 RepID=UPI00064BD9BC|nr:hypothetical protein [Nocardiopsis sp. RV163]